MTIEANYARDEWDLIVGAPALIALVIIEADHCSRNAAYRKVDTAMVAMNEAVEPGTPSELIQAVQNAVLVGQTPRWPTEYPRDLGNVHGWALDSCRRLVTLLAQKAPEADARAYTSWLLRIGQRVAAVPDNTMQPGSSDAMHDERQRVALEDLALVFGVAAGDDALMTFPGPAWLNLPL